MSNISISFPADRLDLANRFGHLLLEIAQEEINESDHGGVQPDAGKAIIDDLDQGATTVTGAADQRVDSNGVPFNEEFCSNAAKPFFTSTKRKGQWKKKQGVDYDDYDDWYSQALKSIAGQDVAVPTQPAPVNTQEAFNTAPPNNIPAQPGTVTAPAAAPPPQVAQPPQDTGSFMAWISEKQAAGLLTEQQVGAAYANASIAVMDLFPPNTPEVITPRINTLYGALSQIAGA